MRKPNQLCQLSFRLTVSKFNSSAATAHCKYILILLILDLIFKLPLKILGWGQWLNNLCEAQWSCYKKYYVIAKAFLHRKWKTIKSKPPKLIVSIFPSLMQTQIRTNTFKRNCRGFQVKKPRTYSWERGRMYDCCQSWYTFTIHKMGSSPHW